MASVADLPESVRAIRERRRAALLERLRAALAARPTPGVVEVRLFGSWARGDFDGLSDVDLLVVTDRDDVAFDAIGLPGAERIEAVVATADRLAERLARGHPFYARIMAESVPLFRAAPRG